MIEVERGLALASGRWDEVDRCETEDDVQVVPRSGLTPGGCAGG